MSEWQPLTWGDVATLEYGKSLRDYKTASGEVPVYGTNGPIGFTEKALCDKPGVIIGRKGAYRGVHYSERPFFVIDTAFYLKPREGVELDSLFSYYQLLTKLIRDFRGYGRSLGFLVSGLFVPLNFKFYCQLKEHLDLCSVF